MATVADILNFMESLAPAHMAEDWDKIGLNCGHKNQKVKKILVALDPFPHVCQEAIDMGADLLLTHHPLIWEPGFVTDETTQGQCILTLTENKIAHISAHTNLDCAPGGVNDTLANALGMTDVKVIAPKGTDSHGNNWGLLRMGNVEPQPLSTFTSKVKNALQCDGLRFVDGGKPVCRVAVGGGACGSELKSAANAGCDTFVTSDVKYNQFWEAKELGVNLIDAGHFHTENPVCAVLAKKLAVAFPDTEIRLSEIHRDCIKYC
ncbi:MAG: Nif3-like dinuclear metal center hexameric protein [Oscillospiraceae bacterium]|nr:Nif3-like dinuclear metal center hexameric protein [Oscillospiraceae bacterium]